MNDKMRHVINLMLEMPVERIADLLCCALEGGSNYWYEIDSKAEPKVWTIEERPVSATADEAKEKVNTHFAHYYPFNEGGALLITDARADEPTLKQAVRLDLERIKYGLDRWCFESMLPDEQRTAHPRHLAQFIEGNEDAITGDVFLQYCIFGKVIYG